REYGARTAQEPLCLKMIGSGHAARLEHAGIERELPRTAVANMLEPLIFMAEQGMGIPYLPDFTIGRQLREGLLVAVLDDYTDHSDPFRGHMAVEPASRSQAPSVASQTQHETAG